MGQTRLQARARWHKGSPSGAAASVSRSFSVDGFFFISWLTAESTAGPKKPLFLRATGQAHTQHPHSMQFSNLVTRLIVATQEEIMIIPFFVRLQAGPIRLHELKQRTAHRHQVADALKTAQRLQRDGRGP